MLTRPATTVAGGPGYGVLFGLAFYLPLLRWTSDFVGVRDPDAANPRRGELAANESGSAASPALTP